MAMYSIGILGQWPDRRLRRTLADTVACPEHVPDHFAAICATDRQPRPPGLGSSRKSQELIHADLTEDEIKPGDDERDIRRVHANLSRQPRISPDVIFT